MCADIVGVLKLFGVRNRRTLVFSLAQILPLRTTMHPNPNHLDPATRVIAAGKLQSAKGIVQRVDLVQREVAVLMQNGIKFFDIPPDCPIFLHGERIKLRMMQPRDHVNIRFTSGLELSIASSVEVQPDSGFSCLRL